MELISRDFLVDILKEQLKEKRDDTIKSIDNALQSVSELKHADKDISFDNISDYYICELSTTISTIEGILKAIYPGINVPDPVNELFDDIKTLRYFTKFLAHFTDSINDYKHARKDFNRWTID